MFYKHICPWYFIIYILHGPIVLPGNLNSFPCPHTLALMFIAALFAIARTWKQPKSPSTEEWIKKMWYIYTMKYYLAIKTNEIVPFAEM